MNRMEELFHGSPTSAAFRCEASALIYRAAILSRANRPEVPVENERQELSRLTRRDESAVRIHGIEALALGIVEPARDEVRVRAGPGEVFERVFVRSRFPRDEVEAVELQRGERVEAGREDGSAALRRARHAPDEAAREVRFREELHDGPRYLGVESPERQGIVLEKEKGRRRQDRIHA